MSYRTASTSLTRDLNRAAIFRLIGSSGPIARAQIARRLGLSPATVTAVTRELLQQGLLRVADRSQSPRGRPALLLEIVGGAAAAFGAKVAPDHVVGVRVDLEGEVLDRFEAPFDASDEAAVDELGRMLSSWIEQVQPSVQLLGVGLGVSGVVDAAAGSVDSPLLGWRDVPLAARLEQRLGLPVYVDNDVNTLAVAERLNGRGRQVDHFLTVTIGRGVGLGIVADGDIYRGHGGGAGEFGHTTVVPDGPTCSCGKRGCLEALVGDPALVAEARRRRLLKRGDGIAELRSFADRGNPKAIAVFALAGERLGRAVGDLANILSPELVLISGEGTQAWTHLASSFDEGFRSSLFRPLRGVRVEVDPWDDARWAVGAATLVLRANFAAPLDEGRRPAEARMEVVA